MAPPSPKEPRFFDGKKLVQEISAILSEFLPKIDPKFCAPSSINFIFFGNNFFSLFKSQLLPNREVEITALVFFVINFFIL